MATKYNNDVRALNTAELTLTGACRRVNKHLRPNQQSSTSTSPAVSGAVTPARQSSILDMSPPDGHGEGLRRQFSGPREPPVPRLRRRMLSTNCMECKHREREIGMSDADAQVGKCPHGIQDTITEVDSPVFTNLWSR